MIEGIKTEFGDVALKICDVDWECILFSLVQAKTEFQGGITNWLNETTLLSQKRRFDCWPKQVGLMRSLKCRDACGGRSDHCIFLSSLHQDSRL